MATLRRAATTALAAACALLWCTSCFLLLTADEPRLIFAGASGFGAGVAAAAAWLLWQMELRNADAERRAADLAEEAARRAARQHATATGPTPSLFTPQPATHGQTEPGRAAAPIVKTSRGDEPR